MDSDASGLEVHLGTQNMFVLWDADGNKIEDEYPPEELDNILATNTDPSVLDFDLPGVVARVRAISELDVTSIHLLGENHYLV